MTGKIELCRRCKSRRAGAHHGYFFSASDTRFPRFDQASFECNFYNVFFNFFDGNRGLIDPQYTGTFTGSRTNPAGELREIICCRKNFISLFPVLPIDRIVEFGNNISKRASVMAKRYTAVHTPGRLLHEFLPGIQLHEFPVIILPLLYRTFGR
jgi:hypothetical protein